MSNRLFQGVIHQMKDAVDRIIGVIDENGVIILSGILAERLVAVRNAYLEAGFTFVEEKIKGEWSALVMRKGC